MSCTLRWFRGLFVVVLILSADAFAATPVDIFQDMESGQDGDLLTPAIMNASSHGGGSKWSIHGRLWVSTKNSCNLPGPVTVGPVTVGPVTYPGAGGTRSWMFNDDNQLNYVKCTLPSRYSKITVACYYATGVTIPWVQFDGINFIEATEGTWGVLQVETEDKGGPYLRCHSASAGSKTTYSPTHVKVTVGKPYWVNLHFDGKAGTVSGAVFDPAQGFAQVGATMVAQSTARAKIYGSIRFGRTAAHGDHPDAKSQSYFNNIIVDYTQAAFPLLPSGNREGAVCATAAEPKYLIFWHSPEKAGELAERVGMKGDDKTRLLGFGLPLSTYEVEEHLPRLIRMAFAAAREHDMAVMLHFDFHTRWKNRPDLWNWFDPDKPGYNPNNP